jgi:hypothetical protein
MRSLSGEDIKKFFNGKINVITYPQIKKYDNIDQLLTKHNKCVILYLTHPTYGHWTCCFKNKKGDIEFFDSYSTQPDMEFKYIPKNLRIQYNESIPYLSNLLLKSKYNFEYNPYKFQKDDNDVTSCGHHCCSRLSFSDLSINQYYELIKSFKIDPDLLVSELVESIIDLN